MWVVLRAFKGQGPGLVNVLWVNVQNTTYCTLQALSFYALNFCNARASATESTAPWIWLCTLPAVATQAEAVGQTAAVKACTPARWTEWVAVLLPKPGEDPALFHRRRDIWLQPHGLKLFMLTLRPGYDIAARNVVPQSQSGFAAARNAPEATLTIALTREAAASRGGAAYRGFCDYATFFESICRDVQRYVERETNVPCSTTKVVMALHDATTRRIDTGSGLTLGVDSLRGLGQGDVSAPVRSKLLLAQMHLPAQVLARMRIGRTHAAG